MRIQYFLLIISLLLSVLAFGQMQNVDAVEFNKLIQKGDGVIVDVRTPGEYQRGHIESSTLISIADKKFVDKISLLSKDSPVYLYCLTGSRSRSAGNYMARIGFTKVYNLERGILDWHRNNFPIVVTQQAVASKAEVYSSESFAQLLGSKDLVLIDFHAVWCAPCKKMSPVIEELKGEFNENVRIEKIDVEANRGLAESLQVQSIPGFVLFKNGKSIWKHTGMISKEELAGLLKKYL